jgi:hypothetical protein
MLDVIFIAASLIFFLVAVGYVKVCESLQPGGKHDS